MAQLHIVPPSPNVWICSLTIGALRRERDEEITNRFLRAYAEDADLAMKTLFFARDIRGGIGERRVFRTILKWLANNEPRSLGEEHPVHCRVWTLR